MPGTTTTQEWLRDHSRELVRSFESSGRIRHSGAKGTSREFQILDTLRRLLPTRITVEATNVILDRHDQQSPMFDGALVDRQSWPRLYATETEAAVMIESVLAAVEIKSTLDKTEVDDVFRKASALRAMASQSEPPLVTAFAYQCPSLNLAFFDFALGMAQSPLLSPSLICVLNRSVFGLVREAKEKVFWLLDPEPDSLPALHLMEEDALLTYVYFLSGLVSPDVRVSDFFLSYFNSLFSKPTCFHFDRDFLDVIREDQDAAARARACFARRARESIEDLYAAARTEAGLG